MGQKSTADNRSDSVQQCLAKLQALIYISAAFCGDVQSRARAVSDMHGQDDLEQLVSCMPSPMACSSVY